VTETIAYTNQYKHERLSAGDTIASGAHIFGPFEAGFSEQQKSIIEGWGCTDASVAYDTAGGLDLGIATRKTAAACNIQLPRLEGSTYYGIVGPCGGHTSDYHFHMGFSCLYSESGAHSTAIGDVAQWKIYGKWEDYSNNKLPLLDACGAHFGATPDSGGATVYHYHVQDKAPFSVGCLGPTADNKLVGVATCRALYGKCSNDAETLTVVTSLGSDTPAVTETIAYTRDCPCWDANGLNTGAITELPALSTSEISCVSNDGVTCATTPSADTTTTTITTTITTTTITVTTTTRDVDTINTELTVTGVDFDSISQDADAMTTLESDVQEVVIAQLPKKYKKRNVRVRFRKGSVIANVTIDVEPEDDSDALTITLTNATSMIDAELCKKVKGGKPKKHLEQGKTVDNVKCVSSKPKKKKKKGGPKKGGNNMGTSAVSGAHRIALFTGLLGCLLAASWA
jgi:hypothetical protein